jgi:hypothetical protein
MHQSNRLQLQNMQHNLANSKFLKKYWGKNVKMLRLLPSSSNKQLVLISRSKI